MNNSHVREPFRSILNDLRDGMAALERSAQPKRKPMPPKREYVRDIRLTFEQPPIPMRDWDWRAMHDGDDEEPSRHGWGRTPVAALANLLLLDEELKESLQTESERLLEEYP